jgi:hypothetical protein
MGRRSQRGDPEKLRRELMAILTNFESQLAQGALRDKVRSLVPAYEKLADLGNSVTPVEDGNSGFDRLLSYLRRFQGEVIGGQELRVVSGIHDYPRRIRELRKENGWPVLSGRMLRELREEELEETGESTIPAKLKVDDYILIAAEPDEEAAERWRVGNAIRRKQIGVGAKILEFFRANVGRPVTGEELRYVANNKTEWARRTRELRTEQGWDIATRMTERPDLPIGTYVLQSDHQAEPHDRTIKDNVRVQVLKRDHYSCRFEDCDFDARVPHIEGTPRRRLELHHKQLHSKKGSNEPNNLVTLCNVHHDDVHARGIEGVDLDGFLKPVP